ELERVGRVVGHAGEFPHDGGSAAAVDGRCQVGELLPLVAAVNQLNPRVQIFDQGIAAQGIVDAGIDQDPLGGVKGDAVLPDQVVGRVRGGDALVMVGQAVGAGRWGAVVFAPPGVAGGGGPGGAPPAAVVVPGGVEAVTRDLVPLARRPPADNGLGRAVD